MILRYARCNDGPDVCFLDDIIFSLIHMIIHWAEMTSQVRYSNSVESHANRQNNHSPINYKGHGAAYWIKSLCCTLTILFSIGCHIALADAITPPKNWTSEEVPIVITYSASDPIYGVADTFATGDEACVYAITPSAVPGPNAIVYSGGTFGVDPDYGQGCYYDVKWYNSQGDLVQEDPNWFGQHWAGVQGTCPDDDFVPEYINGSNYATTCARVRPVRTDCPCYGDPVSVGNGDEFQREVDYSSSSSNPELELKFVREYSTGLPLSNSIPYLSSGSNYTGSPLGDNWFIEKYGRFLSFETEGSNQYAYAVRTLGDVQIYQLQSGAWISEAYNNDTLVQLSPNQAPAAWQYTNASDNSVELYDDAGKLLSITTRSGLVTTLQYSDTTTPVSVAPRPGLLIGITNPVGRTLSFNYDSHGLLIKMIDPAGQQYLYNYSVTYTNIGPNPVKIHARLTTVTYPDGKQRSYMYETQLAPQDLTGISNLTLSGPSASVDLTNVDFQKPDVGLTSILGEKSPVPLTGIIDENGSRFATITYDNQGRALTTQHAGGAELSSFVYNNGSTDFTDALGTTRHFTTQNILNVKKVATVTQPCADCSGTKTSTRTYDANGNLASKTDFNGIETTYIYDPTRNLETSRTEAYGTPQARTITTQWHPTFSLPTLITESGKTTAFTYDSAGNLTQKTITDTATSTSRTWHYTYNSLGLVISVDGPRTDVSDITTYGYDAQGNLTTITNALNQVTQITSYDANGRPFTIVDPNGLTTTLTYTPRGWLTSRAVSDGTTTETTTYDYDGVGQLTKVTLPDNSYISYTYDAAHRLTGIADSLGNHIDYTLDAMGNRTQENIYDPGNTLTQTRSHVYDALNKLAQDIGAQNQTTNYSYDNHGNLTSISDPLGHTTTNGYDALNRLVQVTDPNNGVTQYGYDTQNHLTSVTDPRNIHTTYDYDALNDLDQQVSPDTGITSNSYDAAGNIITATDARGVVTEYAYDTLNRLISKTYPASPANNITYSYDQGTNGIGRLTAIIPADGNRIDYRYDGYGNVIDEIRLVQGVTFDTRYTYDTRNRLATMTYPSGRIVAYGRDTQGRISSITTQADAQAPIQTVASQISYQPFGSVAGLTYGNGQVLHMTYNLDGRITDIRDDGTNGAIDDNTLDYDPAGDIAAISDGLDSARNQTYTYDALQRLTQAVGDYGHIDYRYDSVGNRTSRKLSQGTHTEMESFTYDTASNRLQQISRQIDGVSGTRQFGYDATGNIITDALDTDTFTFAYNSANRLTAVGDMAQYLVNPLGQREFKHIYIGIPNDANGDGVLNNDDIKYVRNYIRNGGAYNSQYDCDNNGVLDRLDPRCMRQILNALRKGDISTPQAVNISMAYTYDQSGRLLQEYNVDTGQVENEYIYLAGRPIAVITGGSLYFVQTNQLNTPRVITDNTDKIVWRWDSDPFGTTAANDDPDMDGIKFTYNLRFPGQYHDQEMGLNYNYFRNYDPSTGRYIESDPVGLVGGLNSYSYVGNNPLRSIDPLGLDATILWNDTGGRNPLYGPTNGNWGGKCWSGGKYSCTGHGNAPPTDSADACYMRHDECYESGVGKSACDRKLVDELKSLPSDPRKWPRPPRSGTEPDTMEYLTGAIILFKH